MADGIGDKIKAAVKRAWDDMPFRSMPHFDDVQAAVMAGCAHLEEDITARLKTAEVLAAAMANRVAVLEGQVAAVQKAIDTPAPVPGVLAAMDVAAAAKAAAAKLAAQQDAADAAKAALAAAEAKKDPNPTGSVSGQQQGPASTGITMTQTTTTDKAKAS